MGQVGLYSRPHIDLYRLFHPLSILLPLPVPDAYSDILVDLDARRALVRGYAMQARRPSCATEIEAHTGYRARSGAKDDLGFKLARA